MSSAAVETTPRDRLLTAAFELVDADEALSMDAVAQASGVSRASAYRIFAGVREMVAALTELQSAHHVAAVLAGAERESDAVAKLEAIAVYTVTTAREDPRMLVLMPQVGMAADAAVRRMAAEVSDPIIAAGQEAGCIRDDVTPAQISGWLLDSFVGGTAYRRMTDAEARDFFRTFFVPALLPRGGGGLRAELEPVAQGLREALAAVEKVQRSGR